MEQTHEWEEDLFAGLERLSQPGFELEQDPKTQAESTKLPPRDGNADFALYAEMVTDELVPARLA